MKLTDYVANFIYGENVRHVFGIMGGASLHIIHSIEEHTGVEFLCSLHEQASAMSAEAYSRITRNLGVAVSTSGPGATNMITGISGAYYDSVPVLFITGQVSTFRFKGKTGVRQYGFQETDIVQMCAPVTKYAVTVEDPKKIRFELEKACYIARSGRPGPVLVDIPDNLQREDIVPQKLEGFTPKVTNNPNISALLQKCINLLEKSKRPVIILGWGVRLSGADKEALELINSLEMPVVLTWGMVDFLPAEHSNLVGTFGTHGTRYGNLTVQNADLILAIGTRLDTHETGSPLSTFARDAVKIVVDIDHTELDKAPCFGMSIDVPVVADARYFIRELLKNFDGGGQVIDSWWKHINNWKKNYPVCLEQYYEEESVNPYVFVHEMSEILEKDIPVVIDTGCSIAWMMQGFQVKKGQRLIHDFNNTAMGYALPASMGISAALDRQMTICVTGDGSLHMNIQELATIAHHNYPVKIILLNNDGYSMIQQTQDQWMESKYIASSKEGGLPVPDFSEIASGYGFTTFEITQNSEIASILNQVLTYEGPCFCNVRISPNHRVIPQVKYGRPIEDAEPLLDRDEFEQSMIVSPLEEPKV
jgi:acetolactate synthase I/II/III large subunit